MKIVQIVFTSIVVISILTGCASSRFASQEQSSKARSFSVEPGMANIYLYKTEADEGARGQISVNDKLVGKLESGTFYQLVVSPDKYEISVVGEDTSVVQIVAEAGKNYFIWQDVFIGTAFGGRATINYELKAVSDEIGKQRITESKMMLSGF